MRPGSHSRCGLADLCPVFFDSLASGLWLLVSGRWWLAFDLSKAFQSMQMIPVVLVVVFVIEIEEEAIGVEDEHEYKNEHDPE